MNKKQASVFANGYSRLRALLVSFFDSQRAWNDISAYSTTEAAGKRNTAKTNSPGGVVDMDIGAVYKGGKLGQSKSKDKNQQKKNLAA